ncbi:MAG: hypothetical protein ACOX5R_12715 [bacterium]
MSESGCAGWKNVRDNAVNGWSRGTAFQGRFGEQPLEYLELMSLWLQGFMPR